jgi:hypothetical protein
VHVRRRPADVDDHQVAERLRQDLGGESPWRDVISLAPDFVYGIANSGLLPWGLSAATTLLALVTFIPGAWLVHALLKGHALA